MLKNANVSSIEPQKKKHRTLKTLLAVLVVLLVVLYFVPSTRAFVEYPAYFVRCGGRPIIAHESFLGERPYYVPGTVDYQASFSDIRAIVGTFAFFQPDFFCSEEDAQNGGYAEATFFEQALVGIAAREAKDPSICEKSVDIHQKDLCYVSVAEATHDPAACRKVSSEGFRANCYDDLAEELGDPKICDAIDDHDKRLWCMFGLVSPTDRAGLCGKFESNALGYQEACYSYAAYTLKDESYCDHLYAKELLDPNTPVEYCKRQVAFRMNTNDPCNELLGASNERKECYVQRALNEKNPSLCERIGHGVLERKCFDRAASGG
ncbi:MAG: hypothetical protein ACYSUQ_03250 [Planctomycetota bacterium]|jgi:hypothetical protein